MTATIAVESLTFRYGSGQQERPVLDQVSFQCPAGSVNWLFGRLGAGCSTLLLAVAGLAPRHTGGRLSGTVQLLGHDPQTENGRRVLAGRVGYVTAVPALQLSGIAATVWAEAAFAPANLGWPIERIRTAVDGALDRLGVGHLADRDPTTLSGGELQRVVLAGMLALEPDIWLLDDPATALDPAGRRVFAQLLRGEAARGATVLVASEDADQMLDVADRILVLEAGRIAADGTPRERLSGQWIWQHGPGSTSVAALAHAAEALGPPVAALAAPYPLTPSEAEARWS